MAKYKNQSQAMDLVDVAKALSDMNRLRALGVLDGRELCVCQIIELLELAPSTVSKHMSILRRAGLVTSRKEGRWVYYRLPPEAPPAIAEAIEWATAHLAETSQANEDNARIKEILQREPERLCKEQNAS